MTRNIDLILGVVAWIVALASLFGPLIIYFLELLPYQPLFWLICIGGVVIFRKRPLQDLWWISLSALLIGYAWVQYLFIAATLALLAIIIYRQGWHAVISLKNADFMFGALAWICGLGVLHSNYLSLPGGHAKYDSIYFPVAWVVCILAMLILKKHPWKDLWWVFLSAPLVWWHWLGWVFFLQYMLLFYRP